MRYELRRVAGCVWGLAASSLLATAVVAKIVPALDIPGLCADADLVAVGRVDAIRPDGETTLAEGGATYPAQFMDAELKVEKVLKGVADETISFRFMTPTVPVVGVGGPGVAAGQFGVFFLQRGARGYEVLNPDYPFILAAPGAPKTGGSTLVKVTGEIAHVLKAPEASTSQKAQAISLLGGLQAEGASEALETAARSQPVNLRLLAMGALFSRNDISFLPEARKLLLSNDPAIPESTREAAAGAIGFGVKDPRAVPFLIPLLQSSDVFVRRGATTALRNIHDPAAIKPLAGALYDPDHEVRYSAVVGLGEITGQNEWTPAIANFDQNEQKFLKYWRDWAKVNVKPENPTPPQP